MRPSRAALLGLALLLPALSACLQGPKVADPRIGETRFLCCNLRYEKPAVTDNPYQVGTLIPVGTRVQITGVRKNSVTFQPDGYPAITMVNRYGKKVLPMDGLIDRWLVTTDPKPAIARLPKKIRPLVEAGQIEKGMTRQQVLWSWGYPPANRTPDLASPQWSFWENRWHQMVVYFDGDKVSLIQR
ncbi:MAG: DUF4222 domain-containing protein [bacterium]|nr:DUF4222 domain-containing protein [bacterium]